MSRYRDYSPGRSEDYGSDFYTRRRSRSPRRDSFYSRTYRRSRSRSPQLFRRRHEESKFDRKDFLAQFQTEFTRRSPENYSRSERSFRYSPVESRSRYDDSPLSTEMSSSSILDKLYREMNEQERFRRELEEEKRRLQENDRSILLPSVPAPPIFSRAIPSTSKADPLLNQITMTSGDASSLLSWTDEDLRPGNYLIAYWNATVVSLTSCDVMVQLGLHLPHGVGAEYSLLPDDTLGLKFEDFPGPVYHFQNGHWFYHNPVSKRLFRTLAVSDALSNFIALLERGVQSIRPSYDGVLLISYSDEATPLLLKSFKKYGLWDRFAKTIKGVGDICTFLATNHAQMFMKRGGDLNLEFRDVVKIVLDERILPRLSCQDNCVKMEKVMLKLLENAPTYSNFQKHFIAPLSSRSIQRMSIFKTLKERRERIMPLKFFLQKELRKISDNLVINGIYHPPTSQLINSPRWKIVTEVVCKTLTECELDMDKMLELYTQKGKKYLEDTIRTTLIGTISQQSKSVISQTSRISQLIITFFRENEGMGIDVLLRKTKAIQNQCDYSPEKNETSYQTKFIQYEELHNRIKMYLSKKDCKDEWSSRALPDIMINVLLQSDLEYNTLIENYMHHRKLYPKSRRHFRDFLYGKLKTKFNELMPEKVSLQEFINAILEHLGVNYHTFRELRESKTETIERSSKQYLFDNVTRNYFPIVREQHHKCFVNTRRYDVFSLEAIRIFLIPRLSESIHPEVADKEQYAQEMAQQIVYSIASLGLSHYQLVELYGDGEESFVNSLTNTFKWRGKYQIPGLPIKVLIDYLVQYIKNFNTHVRNKS